MSTTLRHRERTSVRRVIQRSASGRRHLTRISRNGTTRTFALSQRAFEDLIEDLEMRSSKKFLASIRQADRDIANGRTYTLEEVKRELGIR